MLNNFRSLWIVLFLAMPLTACQVNRPSSETTRTVEEQFYALASDETTGALLVSLGMCGLLGVALCPKLMPCPSVVDKLSTAAIIVGAVQYVWTQLNQPVEEIEVEEEVEEIELEQPYDFR